MAGKLNNNFSDNGSIVSIISSDKFAEYSPEMQQEILKKMVQLNQSNGGLMGRIFGNKRELASMNIALIICGLLLIAGGIVNEQQFWSGILPVIGAALGYIFGKGGGKAE